MSNLKKLITKTLNVSNGIGHLRRASVAAIMSMSMVLLTYDNLTPINGAVCATTKTTSAIKQEETIGESRIVSLGTRFEPMIDIQRNRDVLTMGLTSISKNKHIDITLGNIEQVTVTMDKIAHNENIIKVKSIHSEDVNKLESELVTVNNNHQEIKSEPRVITICKDDMSKISNATAEEMEMALSGTWLEGYGQLFYELENKYHVNAFLAMGNAFQETGWKRTDSRLAMECNNIFGLMGKEFDSISKCIEYYFRLINKCYIGQGLLSMSDIGRKYCPPDSTWDDDIYSIAIKLNNKVAITNR